ncbi:MAG: hypothetical protein ACO1OQ_01120 [Rufibacter sp.]
MRPKKYLRGSIAPTPRRLLTPIGLDLYVFVPEERRKDVPKYQYLVHAIIAGNYRTKQEQDCYTPLDATTLQDLFTSHKARSIVDDLQDWGIIEVLRNADGRESYQALSSHGRKGRCKSYRLTPAYRERGVTLIPWDDAFILRKLAKARQEQNRLQDLAFPQSVGLREYLEEGLLKLKINSESAFRRVESEAVKASRPIFTFKHANLSFLAARSQNWALSVLAKREGKLKRAVLRFSGFNLSFTLSPSLIPPPSLSYVMSFFENESARNGHVRYLFSPVKLRTPTGERTRHGKAYKFIKLKSAIGKTTFENLGSLIKAEESFRRFDFERQSSYRPAQYHSDKVFIERWQDCDPLDMQFSRDEVGRGYSPLVLSPKRLRKFFYLESGEPLVSLDIKGSQAFLINSLVSESYRGQPLPEDAELYKRLTCPTCKEVDLYSFLMGKMGLPVNEKSRDIFKQQKFFGQMVYCRFFPEMTKTQKVFYGLFPSVYKTLERYKMPTYKRLPEEMQRRESQIMIDTVCVRLMRENGTDFFFQPIHDCIITTQSKAAYVKSVIEQAFQDRYGITPFITEKPL